MLSIRVIGWSDHTEETIAEIVGAATWQEAVRQCYSKYAGELRFVVALDESYASLERGFSPVGRWETLPTETGGWRQNRSGQSKSFSIIGFDHRALIPVLDWWTAPNWTMAAQRSVTEYRYKEYRFVAAFEGKVPEASILGYFAPGNFGDMSAEVDPVKLRAVR
jgi:hypothetical protein